MAVSSRENTLALLRRIVSALDDKKATDIRIIEVGATSGVTDFYVLATGTSDPHLRSLSSELERVLDEDKVKVVGVESQPGSGWTVVDMFDVIVHLLSPEQRSNFRLEQLWKDGKPHPVSEFITGVERVVSDQAVSLSGGAKKPVAKKAPVKKAAGAKAPAKKSEPKILVKKAVLKRTAAEKSKPASEKKLPGKKLTAKAKAEAAEGEAPKKAVKKSPAKKAAEKKIVAKKEAKAAKTVRAIAKQKAQSVAKKPVVAKAGVVTRKGKSK